MSSILTVYQMPEARRAAFEHAHANEKTVTYKSGFFGKKEIVTGERYLWEYLDEAAIGKIDFPYSGFLFIEYFFTFLELPDDIQAKLNASALNDHYYLIDAVLAAEILAFLDANAPSAAALASFAESEGRNEPDYIEALLSTHSQIAQWLSTCTGGTFLVLHLTF